MFGRMILLCTGWLAVSITVQAADWSEFRGADNDGIASVSNVPTEWSPDKNIAWKAALPGASNGSPIISNGHVFLTSAEDQGRKRHLHCFDAADGTVKWVQTVNFDQVMPTHKTNQYGGSTPAADGQHVVVWHSSAGLYCYDFEGNEIWSHDLGDFRHQWGYGTSPVLNDGRVILHSGPGAEVFVAGFDVVSGRQLWKTDEPVENDGERNSAGKYMGSWSSPVIAEVQGRNLAIVSLSTRVNAYDPENGRIVFTCDGLRGDRGDLSYTSPTIAGDICVALGGFQGPAIGFRMQGTGNITDEQLLWRQDKGNPQRIGSGVVVDGYIYLANAGPNLIQCLDPETGSNLWEARSPGSAAWGSMVYADGRIYTTDQDGTTHVLQPSTTGLKVLASNPLGESSNSTPAVTDGRIYVRTFQHLYCISE